jgi:hypothetical protein
MEATMTIPKIMTHIQVAPRAGKVEFHIEIDEHAAITTDADLEVARDLIDTLEGNPDVDEDDEALLIDEG